MSEIQQELFTAPVNNRLVATVGGTKLYTNPKLQEKYIEAMQKTSPTKKIGDLLPELVEKEKIIPCWLNKNLLHYIAYKIFAPIFIKGVAGFFSEEENQIFLLIDNNVTFGHASNNFLSVLTVHEGTHMFAHNNTNKFLRTFNDEIKTWYYHFFFNYLDLKVKYNMRDFALDNFVSFLFKNVERGMKSGLDKKSISGYKNRIYSMFKEASNLTDDNFEQRVDDLLMFIRMFDSNPDMILNIYRKYKDLTDAMYESYKQSFGIRNMTTLCVQELLFPSEIISIYVERIESSKIKTMFQGIL